MVEDSGITQIFTPKEYVFVTLRSVLADIAQKVCLSLLGTWQGPGWIAGQSTLLQVLISIQSLIMCEEPYLNEPGWANDGGSANSKAYSANVRRMVLIDAMAENIKNPPYPCKHFHPPP